jgi:elongation factor Ts
MMDCKKALVEAGGNFDEAITILRKKGQKVSANRADRDAKEGVVLALTSEDNTFGLVVRLSCETDFVAKNEDFVQFATSIAKAALSSKSSSLEEVLKLDLGGVTVEEKVNDYVAKIGEKISVSDYSTLTGDNIVPYIHTGNRIGVLVSLNQKNDAAIVAGKDVAMQIAAMNPVAVDKNDVDATIVEREIEIGKEQARQEGKPEAMLEKIALGKLNKFYQENTLLNQIFVKNGELTIAKMLDGVSAGLTVNAFKRVALG